MRNVNIVIGSVLMAAIVVGAHSLVQYIFTKEMPNFLETRKIILFVIVFISCIGLSKREASNE
ncbi:hypothetical protein [Sporosarcina koreensis]|uniref:hypothetical protein n=1 Tax=Bacillales TaxID=1385 RepID=UPI00075F196E|nr:hypothetical protein [Sporosarcina koreensis]